MDAAIKKTPYGMTNFESIICDNYYYVDKTDKKHTSSSMNTTTLLTIFW